MRQASVTIDREEVIGRIGEGLMGSFAEHTGRSIYTGVYEPTHPTANEDGFRQDVIAEVKELGVPLVRYPGGNFVSGYHWTDGIGPRESRPRRPELAWKSIETNQVGIDDFAKWAGQVGCEIMPAVNMGTGTPQEAADLVEYCNFARGTYWSDKRRENGREEPYGFRYWCIGNEMDGDWQIGHLTAEEYGRKAHETIKLMKWMDSSIQVTVAGSSSPDLPTFPEWDRIVLEHTYNETDYISLHRYYGYDPAAVSEHDYLHSYLDMDRFIRLIVSTADYVKAVKRSPKTMLLSFDEWNVWHQHSEEYAIAHEWSEIRPILEDSYTMRDALVFCGMMMTLINHADRVKIGCMAQLVNVLAPILTAPGGGLIRQTIFYPYQAGCRYARGQALRCKVRGEKTETIYGDADPVYTAAAMDEEAGRLTVFLLNCSKEAVDVSLQLEHFKASRPIRHLTFGGQELGVRNTFEDPFAAVMREAPIQPGDDTLQIPGYTFQVLEYAVE